MLAVDGKDPSSTPLLRSERELACGNEALLVREREIDPELERRKRRGQTRKADHGVEDHVRLGKLDERIERRIAAERDEGHVVRSRDRPDVVAAATGGHGAELELGMRVDDLERLPADRARGAEEGNTFHLTLSVDAALPAAVQTQSVISPSAART